MIDKLEMFIALAREGHFGRAAESLGVTQPTLSAGIKSLEAQLGQKLFIRDTGTVRLTPMGEAMLPKARSVLSALDDFHKSRGFHQRLVCTGIQPGHSAPH